jgi:hypothetical protein
MIARRGWSILAAGCLLLAGCKGDEGPTSPITDDPRTPVCQRGELTDGQVQNSSLEPGDCLSAITSVLAEVWTMTVPEGEAATVTLTPVFDGVLVIYTASGSVVTAVDQGFAGEAEVAYVSAAGDYLVVVAGFEPTDRGAYSIVADIGPLALQGVYAGTASGTYAGFPFSAEISFALSTSGSVVTGSWTTDAGVSGTLTGTISGSTLTFTLAENVPCTGSWSGTANIQQAGAFLSGSFSGSDCGGSGTLTFTAERQ